MKYFAVAALCVAQFLGVNSQLCESLTSFNGTDCVPLSGTEACSPVPTAAKLVSQPIAELMLGQSSLVNNVFTFTVQSSSVQGRTIESIGIQDNSLNPLNTYCQYPDSTNYTRSADLTGPCFDKFEGKFTFQELVHCGLAKTASNSTYDQYSAFIYLSGKDKVGKLRTLEVERTTTSRLKILIGLPTKRQITLSPLTVISPIALDAAITLQDYDPTIDTATIEITTSVQYPYVLLGSNNRNPPSGLEIGYSTGDSSECLVNQPCVQKITVTIGKAQDNGCSFSGSYGANIGYTCHPSFANCPVQDQQISLNFDLDSGNVCPNFQIDSQLTGKIESSTDDFNTLSSVFSANRAASFRIVLTSGVNIQHIGIDQLTIGGKTVDYEANQYSFEGSYISDGVYEFTVVLSHGSPGSGSLFEPANPDDIITFSVDVIVRVTYVTTFKRDIQSERFQLSQQFFLDTNSVAESITSTVSESSSSVVLPAAAFIAGGIVIGNL